MDLENDDRNRRPPHYYAKFMNGTGSIIENWEHEHSC